ncbi:MAG: ATP-dependent Clp protease ATP-binding subunit [Bacillota bacterium]|nr:ATP-dependent Clp protease ATP-binding subunit [Bacillota bacterium]
MNGSILCSKCKKRPAVFFASSIDGKNMEGLCLTCAKNMDNPQITAMLDQMGIDSDNIEELENGLMDALENPQEIIESLSAGEGEGGPFDMISKMFAKAGRDDTEENDENDRPGENKTEKTEKSDKNDKQDKKRKNLETYGTNLTAKAREGKIDRVIGRTREITRVIQILNRRGKNNPVLLGEPGVGKTAIAEGLALKIIEKEVPEKLHNTEIYLLDFAALVAGTQFRGQFEARLKALIEETKKLGNIILVIDEVHNIVGAGDAEGAMNAANILKPSLARGDIQVIGATTIEEYRKFIEKDAALERRFQPVMIDEPSIEDSIEILKGIRSYYEDYHKVAISDEVVENAVRLSERYIHDRFLPDKAIDVIDEAASKVNLENTGLIELFHLKDQLKKIQYEKENAVQTDSIEDYQKAAALKIEECKLQKQITELEKTCYHKPVSVEDIAQVIESWTKIPVKSLTRVDSAKLINLEERLHQRVIGQNKAIELVSRAVRRKRANISAAKRPVSFIFVGPTGVGKTELVKALAENLFGNEESLIRLDMSEYMEKHSVSKLIGSPPGYVGYDEAGQLTEKVRRNPYSIILLDEIEKAHEDVFNTLLQVLDDGRITDSHGRTVNFENTVIIMTSNAGSNLKTGLVGFGGTEGSSRYDKALKELFRPEFLNRVDEIVEFLPLTKEELLSIVTLQLKELKKGLANKGVILNVSDGAKSLILERGYKPAYGARPIRRTITRDIEDKVAELVIEGIVTKSVNVDADSGEFIITAE